jgi:hypothetical protein
MRTETRKQVAEFRDFWELLFPGVQPPDDAQWALWLLRHDEQIVRRGLTELATKYRRLNGAMDLLYMAKFASVVMNRLSAARTGAVHA